MVYRRFPKLSVVLWVLFLVGFLIAAAETALRLAGNIPGVIRTWVDFADTNELTSSSGSYTVDSFGIMSFSSSFRKLIQNTPNQNPGIIKRLLFKRQVESNVYELVEQYRYRVYDNEAFFKFFEDVGQMDDDYFKALGTYCKQPINSDGFRSVEFKPYAGKRKKILLLGDSFTYGCNAEPLTESFYDQMLMDTSLIIYNSGIIATDPVQYLSVLNKYGTRLNPDVVVVNFFWGNDLMPYPRQAVPYQYAMYPQKESMVNAAPFGSYLSFSQANKVAKLSCVIPNQKSNAYNAIMAKTVITTRFWLLINKLINNGVVEEDEELKSYSQHGLIVDETTNTKVVINQIKSVCANLHCQCIFAVIPDYCNNQKTDIQAQCDGIFGLNAYVIPPAQANWYNCSNGHFNNNGHHLYAKFLLQHIK